MQLQSAQRPETPRKTPLAPETVQMRLLRIRGHRSPRHHQPQQSPTQKPPRKIHKRAHAQRTDDRPGKTPKQPENREKRREKTENRRVLGRYRYSQRRRRYFER